jgi:hypothetical protein
VLSSIDVSVIEIEVGVFDVLSTTYGDPFSSQTLNDTLVKSISKKLAEQYNTSARGVSSPKPFLHCDADSCSSLSLETRRKT